jgi:hypothetical protein
MLRYEMADATEEPLLDSNAYILPEHNPWSVGRWVLGVALVLLQVAQLLDCCHLYLMVAIVQVCSNTAASECMQQQEQSVAQFNSPYFSVWFNHSFTGCACMAIALTKIGYDNIAAKRNGSEGRTILQVLIEETGLATWERTFRVSLWLVILYKYNVFWAVRPHMCVVRLHSAQM